MTAPAHSRRRRKHRPAWTWLLPLLSIAAAVGIPLLAIYAFNAIARSTDGQVAERVSDPNAPGYEVIVLPSPSHMILSLDPAGDLAMITVLSLGSNDFGGTILQIPPETVIGDAVNDRRIIDVYRTSGPVETRHEVAQLMSINVDEVSVLDEADWAQLVGPAGSIPVDIEEDLFRVASGETETVYLAGNVTVAPLGVSEFLGWVNPGRHPSSRMPRNVAFWTAWMASIAASPDPNIVPGELESGVGRFVRGIAKGVPVILSIDGIDIELPSGAPGTVINVDELQQLVGEMVPFPLPVEEGSRPRVRLLDGVGGLDLAVDYSPGLVGAGAQIVMIGNSTNFNVPQTVVIYHDEVFKTQTLDFAAVLGGAEIQFDSVLDVVFDVTIIIGEDQGLAIG